ncbi:MAG: hypothetical protein HY726_00785 [Candidatus Rokubacteria bacterium]|nr:hypothetical protein [Candidatus Rokubacteria bacterium]
MEYRLRVANLYEDAFYALLGAAGTRSEGPVQGPSRLIEALDTGAVSAGVLLYDRPLEPARAPVATAFGAVRLRPAAPPNGEEKHRWHEVRWDGAPGEQSVWVIASTRPRYTEVRDVALKGTGPLVRTIPHLVAPAQAPAKVLGVQIGFIEGHEGNPILWNSHLSPVLDLSDGVGVVVGVNRSSGFADHVFIVVKHGPSPSTYNVVLAWKRRPHETEAGGDRNGRDAQMMR